MLNKKGLAVHWFRMIGYIVGIMAFLVIMDYIITTSIINSADTHDLEYYLAYNRLVYSKDSVFYYDASIDRVYPGIVDPTKLYEDEDIIKNLFGENEDLGVKLSLGTDVKQDVFYKEDLYETGKYVFELENSIYGGLKHTFPVIDTDKKNTLLLMGLMHKK